MKTLHLMTTLALLGSGGAGAVGLELSAASPLTLRAAVTDLRLGNVTAGFGVSNRAADAHVTFGVDLPAVGGVSSRTDAAFAFGQGYRLGTAVNAALGPVALGVTLSGWTVGAARVEPLVAWAEAPVDLRARGWALDANARYRVNRDVILNVSGSVGGQPNVAAFGEWRRGDLSYRLGGRAGAGVLGVTGGVTWRASDTVTLAADALIGPGTDERGLSGSLSVADVLGEGSSVRLYGVYEPWRYVSLPARYGAEVTVPTPNGEVSVDARGGSGGLGVRGTVRFNVGRE
ncbi:hypothetical protein [Deinococcus maricopensis]|uniref:hypothetical protein n=1 Tax=Deinococcus maricopensis TaxID=309887 RepID=UPI00069369BD|nr:hypothetical protein [Deinococcus maricopensis]